MMDLEPENTMRSFRRAADFHTDWFETDVRVTADGVAVLSHDAEIKTEPRTAEIGKTTMPELAELRFRGETVPTLRELVEFSLERGIRLNIEIKVPEAVPATLEIIREYGLAGKCVVSSFKTEVLAKIKKAEPDVHTGLLAVQPLRGRYLRMAKRLGCSAVHPFHRLVTAKFVEAAHASGLDVNVWTVNGEKDIRRMILLGVDMIITNRADILHRLKQS